MNGDCEYMIIENLKEYIKTTNIVPNYKQICLILREDERQGGRNKGLHFKEMERYFKWHKDGNKFIIDEIYDIPLEKIDERKNTKGNNNVYGKYIEKLILDLLVQKYQITKERKIYLSRDKMLRACDMVNDNYSFGKFNRNILSSFINADSDNVREFYMLNNRNLYEAIERAFSSLASKCLVSWKVVTTVACGLTEFSQRIILDDGSEGSILDFIKDDADRYEIFKETHTTATDEELDIILHSENNVLEEMGLESKKDAFLFDKYSEFSRRVCELLNKISNIKYYYKSYDVIFHEKVVQELEKISQWILEQEERQNIKVTLNGIISNNIVSCAEKRQNKAIEEDSKIFGKAKDNYKYATLERRADDNYVEDNQKIVNTVINNNKGDLTDEMIFKFNEKEQKSKEAFNVLVKEL